MQKISIPNLQPGMVLDKSVFDANGKLLIGAGTLLSDKIIDKLKSFDLSSVYVKNPLVNIIAGAMEEAEKKMPALVQEDICRKSVDELRSAFSNVPAAIKIDAGKVRKIAETLIDEVILNSNTFIHLSDVRIYDDQTYVHSVNVAILSTAIGVRVGYSRKQLAELVVGALLHDVGKLMLPQGILTKRGKLSTAEYNKVKEHPVLGFEVLRKNKDLSLLSAHVAYQHHEKFDGSGYTRAMLGSEIHEYARIVAVADVYEALNGERHYRKAFMPHEAYAMMASMGGTHFDRGYLAPLLSQCVIYPLGAVVVLSNGMLAIVENILPGFQLRPVVRIIAEKEEGAPFLKDKSFSIDLRKDANIKVAKVLPEEKICELIMSYQK